jgi:hypothetical protein
VRTLTAGHTAVDAALDAAADRDRVHRRREASSARGRRIDVHVAADGRLYVDVHGEDLAAVGALLDALGLGGPPARARVLPGGGAVALDWFSDETPGAVRRLTWVVHRPRRVAEALEAVRTPLAPRQR